MSIIFLYFFLLKNQVYYLTVLSPDKVLKIRRDLLFSSPIWAAAPLFPKSELSPLKVES